MSDRTQQVLIWILTVALVAGTVIALNFARGYRPLAGIPGPTSSLPPEIALRFNQVRVIGRSDNQRAWILNADHIDTTRSRTRVDFSGMISATLLKDGKTTRASVTAGRANYDLLRQKLSVSDGITCQVPANKSGKGAILIKGPDLEWEVGSQTIRSNGPVQATFDGRDTLQGDQVVVNLQTRDKSAKNVRATFYVDEDSASSDVPPRLLQELNP
ncbi:MAG: hypothetical protein V4671_03310 [Armatimonadota bacterium]